VVGGDILKTFLNFLKYFFNFYRKFSVICFLALCGYSVSQEVTLECEFFVTFFDEYACILENIENVDPTATVVFSGTHVGDRTNEDVEIVYIGDSNTPFIMPEIFTTFPNVYDFEVVSSNLQSLNFPSNNRLEVMLIVDNNVTRIESGDFAGLDELWILFMLYNNIQEIDETAFEGLENLLALVLIGNGITEIAPRTFHPLENVELIDLENNRLTSVGPETFSENRMATNIYLEFNSINEISPQFSENLRDSLFYLNLASNRCVSESFIFVEDDWDVVDETLQNCFNNFPGTVPELRQSSMNFTGNIQIFDEFGNILARF
jgi:Leucine rich repeat